MSTRRRFTEEFKLEAVKQVVERGFGVAESCWSIGDWIVSKFVG